MDPISDMLISIKNAQNARHPSLQVPYSKYKYEIARALERSGFVGKLERRGKRVRKFLELGLLVRDGDPAIHGVRLISKPSRRLYASAKEFAKAPRGGVVLISTSHGVKTNREAKKEGVGGELIAEIW